MKLAEDLGQAAVVVALFFGLDWDNHIAVDEMETNLEVEMDFHDGAHDDDLDSGSKEDVDDNGGCFGPGGGCLHCLYVVFVAHAFLE